LTVGVAVRCNGCLDVTQGNSTQGDKMPASKTKNVRRKSPQSPYVTCKV